MLRKLLIPFSLLLAVSLSCSVAQFLPAEPGEGLPTATQALIGDVISQPTSLPTQDTTQPLTLDPCTLLSHSEATDILSEEVGPPEIKGGACTYADTASGVHVLSAYAFQGEQARNQWSVRLFLLSVFGLQIDQTTLDEIMALDHAGNQKAILEKISALSAGNTGFTSRSLDGPGELAYWAWKDLGNGVRQGFLVAVKGDIFTGTDLVHGENFDEAIAVDKAIKLVTAILERLPDRFTVNLAVPTLEPITDSPTPVSTPTLVPTAEPVTGSPTPIPSATPIPVEPVQPTPTKVGGGGMLIAFESSQDGNQQIYTMDLTGDNFRRLTFTGANYAPTWSPDSRQIAFYSIRGQEAGLYVMSTSGSGERMLFDRAYISGGPSWSPDGSRIAFTSRRDGNLEVYVINLDGGGLTNLSNNPADDREPDWSPDGSRIAFTSNRGSGISEIWAMNTDGSAAFQITSLGSLAQEPAWSPDGSTLAFVGAVPGQNGQIFTIGLDGASLINLTNNNGMDNHAPGWSPDGVFILFYAAGFKGNWDIYRMNFNGGNPVNLTQAHTTHESFPDWQPSTLR